jgi:hypothetical protein
MVISRVKLRGPDNGLADTCTLCGIRVLAALVGANDDGPGDRSGR